MAVFPVVLDACVLFPPVLRDTLLRSAEKGLYQLVLSRLILAETTRNIIKRGCTSGYQAEKLESAITTAFPESLMQPPDALIAAMTNDPKDRHVLATAVFASASVIVTQNIKDFPAESINPYGIEVQLPDTFLVHLFDLDRNAMTNVIWEQAADKRRPPRSASELLKHLERHAPDFCARCFPVISAIELRLQ